MTEPTAEITQDETRPKRRREIGHQKKYVAEKL